MNGVSIIDSDVDKAERDLLARVDAHITATRFNSIRLLNPNEAGLSRVLIDLLDSKGSHGQGANFLKAFVEYFEIQPSADGAIDFDGNFTATREYEIEDKRRIDIVVCSDEFTLAIENKPWAADQPNQVSDYLAHLKSKRPEKVSILVYLSRDGCGPSDHSISSDECSSAKEEKKLLVIPYMDLVDWLRICKDRCACENINHFLEEFVAYIEFQFAIYDKKIYALFEKEPYFEAAFNIALKVQNKKFQGEKKNAEEKIAGAFAFFRVHVLEQLRVQVDSALAQRDWQTGLDMDFDANFSFGQRLEISIPDRPNYVFSFAFKDRGISEELHWGIEWKDRCDPPPDLKGVAKEFTVELNELSENQASNCWLPGTSTWLCYAKFGNKKWNSAEPWQSIGENDNIAVDMVKKIDDLYNLLKNSELFDRLKQPLPVKLLDLR
jgi:hypothetical protein